MYSLKPETMNSLVMISNDGINTFSSNDIIYIKELAVNTLSETGSNILPNFEIKLYFLAITPSK